MHFPCVFNGMHYPVEWEMIEKINLTHEKEKSTDVTVSSHRMGFAIFSYSMEKSRENSCIFRLIQNPI